MAGGLQFPGFGIKVQRRKLQLNRISTTPAQLDHALCCAIYGGLSFQGNFAEKKAILVLSTPWQVLVLVVLVGMGDLSLSCQWKIPYRMSPLT